METLLIKELDKAFEVKSKIDFIRHHYQSDNDVLFGVIEDTKRGRKEAYDIINKFIQLNKTEWTKGSVINGREVDCISPRIDQYYDFYMPDYLKQLQAPNVWETIEQMEQRTGKKCYGSKKHFITVCICRRFKNPLNGLYVYDDEINGATPIIINEPN